MLDGVDTESNLMKRLAHARRLAETMSHLNAQAGRVERAMVDGDVGSCHRVGENLATS